MQEDRDTTCEFICDSFSLFCRLYAERSREIRRRRNNQEVIVQFQPSLVPSGEGRGENINEAVSGEEERVVNDEPNETAEEENSGESIEIIHETNVDPSSQLPSHSSYESELNFDGADGSSVRQALYNAIVSPQGLTEAPNNSEEIRRQYHSLQCEYDRAVERTNALIENRRREYNGNNRPAVHRQIYCSLCDEPHHPANFSGVAQFTSSPIVDINPPAYENPPLYEDVVGERREEDNPVVVCIGRSCDQVAAQSENDEVPNSLDESIIQFVDRYGTLQFSNNLQFSDESNDHYANINFEDARGARGGAP